MQKLILSGRVGKDAELRRTQTGEPILNFSLACDNGRDKPATWYDCAIWGKRGEALEQHIRKGGSLTLIGRHTVRVHDGKAYQGINVDDLTFNASSKRDDEQGADQSGGGRADYDDEIGF